MFCNLFDKFEYEIAEKSNQMKFWQCLSMSDPRNMANSLGGITEYENETLDTLIQHYDVLKTNNKFGA